MSSLKKLSVFGLGKLGACMAATFAERGFDVLGVDINAEAVRKINAGEAPVDEPLLAETVAKAGKRLRDGLCLVAVGQRQAVGAGRRHIGRDGSRDEGCGGGFGHGELQEIR